jgi:hypothetical protein
MSTVTLIWLQFPYFCAFCVYPFFICSLQSSLTWSHSTFVVAFGSPRAPRPIVVFSVFKGRHTCFQLCLHCLHCNRVHANLFACFTLSVASWLRDAKQSFVVISLFNRRRKGLVRHNSIACHCCCGLLFITIVVFQQHIIYLSSIAHICDFCHQLPPLIALGLYS